LPAQRTILNENSLQRLYGFEFFSVLERTLAAKFRIPEAFSSNTDGEFIRRGSEILLKLQQPINLGDGCRRSSQNSVDLMFWSFVRRELIDSLFVKNCLNSAVDTFWKQVGADKALEVSVSLRRGHFCRRRRGQDGRLSSLRALWAFSGPFSMPHACDQSNVNFPIYLVDEFRAVKLLAFLGASAPSLLYCILT